MLGLTQPMRIIFLSLTIAGLLSAAERVATPIDNDQVRVLDVTVQPHEKTRLHEHKINRVMIYLDEGAQHFEYQGKGPIGSEVESRPGPMESGCRHACRRDHQRQARAHH